MPKVFSDNTYWLRGGRLNEKSRFELTEEEKKNVASCRGMKNDHVCKNPVFACSQCGNYGCSQEITEKCDEQGFKGDKCLHCGAKESRIPVMEDEFDKYVEKWKEEIELSATKGK